MHIMHSCTPDPPGACGPSGEQGEPPVPVRGAACGHGAAWCRMGPHGVAWGRMGSQWAAWPHGAAWGLAWGPFKTNNPKQNQARHQLLFAALALALGQQPTGTAIKAPHPC
jgi:hypothetical protein